MAWLVSPVLAVTELVLLEPDDVGGGRGRHGLVTGHRRRTHPSASTSRTLHTYQDPPRGVQWTTPHYLFGHPMEGPGIHINVIWLYGLHSPPPKNVICEVKWSIWACFPSLILLNLPTVHLDMYSWLRGHLWPPKEDNVPPPRGGELWMVFTIG